MNRICALALALSLFLNAFSQTLPNKFIPPQDTLNKVVHKIDSALGGVKSQEKDTLQGDSVALTLLPDSIAADSLKVDSLAVDSLQTDTLKADSLLPDTVITEIAPVKIRRIDPLDTIMKAYMARIDKIALQRDSIAAITVPLDLDAYYCRLILPPTLYRGALHGVLTTRDSSFVDPKMQRLHAIHYALSRAYVQYPWLIRQTEEDLVNVGTLRHDITEQTIQNEGKLAEKLVEVVLPDNVQDTVVVVTRRPKFWKVWGNTSLRFSQSFDSDNWHQNNGNKSYSGVSTLDLYAHFNNNRKITWENRLYGELGFQTDRNDTRRTFRPTNNRVLLNTKFGYQAWKQFYYMTSVNMETKIVPQYHANSDVCNTDFLSPLDVQINVGMDFRFSIKNKAKNKDRISGSISMSPVSYTIRYVDREKLATGFGVRAGHQSYHKWGPSITMNTNCNVTKIIRWTSRFKWFSNFKCTQMEWEHNVNFTLSKYVSAALQFYPRFDDNAKRYKNRHGNYLMLREWFNVGVNYGF